MNSDRVTSTRRRAAPKVERVAPNALERTEASWGQAAPPDATAAWLCGLLQAGDSFYPTGSYAHSFGLEGLVQAGVVHDRATLRQFLLLSVLPALRQSELPLAVHAWQAFATLDWKRLGELCQLSAALKTAREARAATDNIGRQRAELLATLRGDPLAQQFLQRVAKQNWPCSAAISAALEGRVFSAPLAAVLAGIYYTTISAQLSAAMKLLRLGQNASQSLLTELLAEAPTVVAAAEQVTLEDLGWFNPWLDIAAARHESADSRMFIS
jgi:urease accessory protein